MNLSFIGEIMTMEKIYEDAVKQLIAAIKNNENPVQARDAKSTLARYLNYEDRGHFEMDSQVRAKAIGAMRPDKTSLIYSWKILGGS